jgi:hypothetical protein
MSSTRQEADASIHPNGRLAFEDPDTLSCLRREAFESIGPVYAIGILYGLGFAEGMADGLRITQRFDGGSAFARPAGGSSIPMVFRPDGGDHGHRFAGSLFPSEEAAIHRRDYPEPEDPICFTSSGYAAGWYSAILGETILVHETACAARGDARCRFEARRLDDWLAEGPGWLDELLPYLDFEALRERAERQAAELEGATPEPKAEEKEGDMMGGFDSMSPAVHVWGPVMVLPYSGTEDCLVALEAVQEDVGQDQIRVVVIDATGALINAVEAVGLTRLLDAFDSQNLETILVGIGEGGVEHLCRPAGELRQPIVVRGISEGITLGFQMSLASR